MFSVPEAHISQLSKSQEYDVYGSLIEECGELIVAIAKHHCNRLDYDISRKHICEEMAHVLVSMNLLADRLCIVEDDVLNEVKRKALRDGFDISKY